MILTPSFQLLENGPLFPLAIQNNLCSFGPRAENPNPRGHEGDALLGFRVLAPDSFGQVGFPSEDAALLHELPLVGPELGPSNDSNSSQSRWGLAPDANPGFPWVCPKGNGRFAFGGFP